MIGNDLLLSQAFLWSKQKDFHGINKHKLIIIPLIVVAALISLSLSIVFYIRDIRRGAISKIDKIFADISVIIDDNNDSIDKRLKHIERGVVLVSTHEDPSSYTCSLRYPYVNQIQECLSKYYDMSLLEKEFVSLYLKNKIPERYFKDFQLITHSNKQFTNKIIGISKQLSKINDNLRH